ncbi:MAG: YfhO family protein [Prolixibacteraceae bacterium]
MKQPGAYSKFIPYLTAVVLFLLIGFTYMSPVLEGKRLMAQDSQMFQGMSKELVDYRQETGKEALWTNRAFGGMPAYLISTVYKGNIPGVIQKWINVIPRPVNLIVINFLFFFILCLVLKVNVWLSFAGALTFGFASHFFILLQVGHISKVNTLAYMALVVAGVWLAYNNRKLTGCVMAAFGISLMIGAGHPQMTYYAGIMVILIGLSYLTAAVQGKMLPAFLTSSALLLVALLLAVGTNFGRLYTTWEYGQYSTRGKSELTIDQANQTGGLDKNYILDYSYDLGEAMTAFIPRFKGGGMSEPVGENSEVYQFFEKNQGKDAAKRISAGLPLYWGSQPISAAPFYYGAVLCFLFVLGLFLVKGPDKWWIVAVVAVSFLLSLGKNFSILSNLMIDYFPGYNKFRDVKNIIVIQQFAMALMGVLAVRELYLDRIDKKELLKKLKYAWYIVGGLALIFVLIPGLAGDFRSASDARLVEAGWPDELMEALRADRRMVLRTDAFKSLLFVSLAAGVIWLFVMKKLKATYALVIWVLLILTDMWPVNKKYLNNDHFERKSKVETPFQASKADQLILEDKDPDFRVLNLTVSVFNDGSTSWFHKSLGGYHGAKMERYQEVIDHQLFPEIQTLIGGFKSPETIDSLMQSLPVINMLNTKYIIYDPNSPPLRNAYALGHAWFVDDMQLVEDANEEIAALRNFDPAEKALVDRRFADDLKDVQFGGGRESSVTLEEYQPNYLKYKATVGGGKPLAVFSEIWYPKGWKAFVDGEEVNIIRVNYLLRALAIPEGEHQVEFRFEPASYAAGNTVSLASSLILLVLLGGVVLAGLKKRKSNRPEQPV